MRLSPPGVCLAEVTATLSLAADVAMGMPLESGLAICLRALALADAAGLSGDDRNRVHHLALLRHTGCTAETPLISGIVGDELAFREAVGAGDLTSPRAFMPQVLRHLVRTGGLLATAGKLAQMASSGDRMQEAVLAVCEVAVQLADQLGLPEGVKEDLLLSNERWDGKSFLKRVRGDELPIAVRVVQIAECATVHAAIGGPDAAAAIVSERAGAAFDPQLAATFAGSAAELLAAAPDGSLWDGVLAAAPGGTAALAPHSLDEALAAMGEFSDLKSPYTVGHSAGVARLAEAAAGHAGLPASDAVHLRRSGLVHDLGRVCVSSTVWEKESSLTPDEWEQVRLHPYHGDRLLARSPGLAALAATASLHHERCDGSGYHRGVDGRSLPLPARLLAAADVYHAMIEPRAHRPAHSPEEAVGQLRDESRRGTLDADAVECVLIAAGQRPRRRRPGVAGLTAREVDVLRLVARGLATKQIAAELVITPKTADSHIQHIYTKIGVSTRAAATVFAMRQELLEPPGSSGELPM